MIKKKVVIIFLLALVVFGISHSADAQFWRKRYKHKQEGPSQNVDYTDSVKNAEPTYYRHKEKRKLEREERRRKRHYRRPSYTEAAGTTEKPQHKMVRAAKKKQAPEYPLTTLKARYRVDVLAPLYLDDLVKGKSVKDKIPERAMPGVAFYQGVNIAADSLKKAGFDIDIYIHDVASANESAEELTGKNKMDSSDLIIGAVQSKDIAGLAEYAKKKHINFVSALSPADGGVAGNEYFTLMQPSLKTHCEWILADVIKKYPGQKVSLLYRTSKDADYNAYKYITAGGADNINFWQLLCNTLPDKESLSPLFDTSKTNIVIVSVLENGYADSLMKVLTSNFPGYRFDIYGMPSWFSIPNLHKAAAYPNLTINVTTPFDYDLSTPSGAYVSKHYKEDYGTRPGELVFRGYETMFWYANLLKQYGNIFNDKYSDNASAPFTKFEVKTQWDNAGNLLFFENTNILLTTYEKGAIKGE
jgi:hypothetical protein